MKQFLLWGRAVKKAHIGLKNALEDIQVGKAKQSLCSNIGVHLATTFSLYRYKIWCIPQTTGETDAIYLTINVMIRVVTHSCGCSNRLLTLLNMDLPAERCLFLCRYLYWYCYCNTSIRLFVTSLLFFVLLFLPVLFVLLAVRGSRLALLCHNCEVIFTKYPIKISKFHRICYIHHIC